MTATLDVRAASDMSAARADVASLGDAVRGLGSDVDAAGNQARSASLDFDGMGEGADNVSSKSSQAAGAMGDLAGGLDAVGATGAAGALNGVAIATQVAAGAGDVMNLVAETSVGRFVAQTAASVAHRTATIAGAAATGVMTVAQGALNAVMALNPIAIVVIALAALAAGLVLAYKHSETFRNIVDGAFSRARDVVEGAADAISGFIGWLGDLPGAARDAWEAVRDAVSDKIGAAKDDVEDFTRGVVSGVRGIASDVAGAFTSMFQPILTAIGWVQDLIDKIGDIDFPSLGDLLPRGTAGTGGIDTGGKFGPSAGGGTGATVTITVNGAIDRVGTAREIRRLLSDLNVVEGGAPSWSTVGGA